MADDALPEDCLICLQPAVIPTRLNCQCKFACCQTCILEWVQTLRNSSTTSACPLCRRTDVRMITEEGSQDLSTNLCKEGYQRIALWETMRAPLPPAKYGEHKNAPKAGEREVSFTPDYKDYEDTSAHERRYTFAWAAFKGADASFKRPLKDASALFIKAICANAQNPEGYIGVAYLSLLISNNKMARRYIDHVLTYLDENNEDALKLLEYVNANETESDDQQQSDDNTVVAQTEASGPSISSAAETHQNNSNADPGPEVPQTPSK